MNEPDRVHPSQHVRQLAEDPPHERRSEVVEVRADCLEKLAARDVFEDETGVVGRVERAQQPTEPRMSYVLSGKRGIGWIIAP